MTLKSQSKTINKNQKMTKNMRNPYVKRSKDNFQIENQENRVQKSPVQRRV